MTLDLKSRTKSFSISIIQMYASLPKRTEAQVLGRQVLRSGTSVGAHYHEAQRAKSVADLISKIEGGLQELEETGYWLEQLVDSGLAQTDKLKPLRQETEELIRIFVTIATKARTKSRQRK